MIGFRLIGWVQFQMFYRTFIKVLSKFLKRSLNISIFEIQLTKRQNPDRSGGKIEEMDMQTNLEFDFWSGKWEFLDQNFLNIRINVFSVRNPISLVSLGYLFDFASIYEISTPLNFIFWTVFGSYLFSPSNGVLKMGIKKWNLIRDWKNVVRKCWKMPTYGFAHAKKIRFEFENSRNRGQYGYHFI